MAADIHMALGDSPAASFMFIVVDHLEMCMPQKDGEGSWSIESKDTPGRTVWVIHGMVFGEMGPVGRIKVCVGLSYTIRGTGRPKTY